MPHEVLPNDVRPTPASPQRKQSSHSVYARTALMSNKLALSVKERNGTLVTTNEVMPPPVTNGLDCHADVLLPARTDPKPVPGRQSAKNGVGIAASDTPWPSAPSSPRLSVTPASQKPAHRCLLLPRTPLKQNSGASTPRIRPTTLDIPGLTKSKVSPDGRIAQRDVGSKLVIVMVGLPARGKSYITKKLARYLNWLQHDTKIFNVGEKRRIVAHHGPHNGPEHARTKPAQKAEDALTAARILINGDAPGANIPTLNLPEASMLTNDREEHHADSRSPQAANAVKGHDSGMDGSASFFDPNNARASAIREQCAVETLDELLHYVLEEGGSVGILDATNSTLHRRQMVMQRIRERAGDINVLFVESICEDETLLEANMRLKLSGPDYKDKDPIASLEDFKKRVELYKKKYVPLGEYEEKHNMPYVKMIDVGRKVISHQIKGFLSAQAVYYLLNFNLTPRQIWITRHGESLDNMAGKIGGNCDLSPNGRRYGQALMRFVREQRVVWEQKQAEKQLNTHFPPHPGDHTPPNPHFSPEGVDMSSERSFCVWTSMLKRSVQTGDYFGEDEFDVKQMRMLDELNAGNMEGMTYTEIRTRFPQEYVLRQHDKLAYRYPGPGGEGYLDVINRLRPVIVELERMTDHCLIITHRSVARVLLAYFMGLRRDQVADLDCPLGMLYALEPKPYGVEFKAYRYNPQIDSFEYLPEFQLKKAPHPH